LKRVDVDKNFPSGLNGVGVEVEVGFCGDVANFFEWLDGAEFVVGVHDGDEHGFLANGAAQIFYVNLSFSVDRQIGNAHALFF